LISIKTILNFWEISTWKGVNSMKFAEQVMAYGEAKGMFSTKMSIEYHFSIA
jgi:hypothetical protein